VYLLVLQVTVETNGNPLVRVRQRIRFVVRPQTAEESVDIEVLLGGSRDFHIVNNTPVTPKSQGFRTYKIVTKLVH
jgi:hypothetical protein